MSDAAQGDWIDPDRRGPQGVLVLRPYTSLTPWRSFDRVFLVWADHAVLDEVTRGQARVIPSSQVQLIQNLEGGILADVMVREGDLVDKDQVLLRIDNTTAQSNYDDLHSRYLAVCGHHATDGGDRGHGGRTISCFRKSS